MIIKLVKGRHRSRTSLNSLVKYLTCREERISELGYQHIYPKDPSLVAVQMESATKCFAKSIHTIPYKHYVLSWPYDKEQYYPVPTTQLVNDFCREMGFNNCQYFFVKHQDTINPHIHLIVNRIDMVNRKLIKDEIGFEIRRIHQVREKLEMKYQIEHDLQKKPVHRPKITQQEFLRRKKLRQEREIERLIETIDSNGYKAEALAKSHWSYTHHPQTGEPILANKMLKIYIRQSEIETVRQNRKRAKQNIKVRWERQVPLA